MSEVLEMKEPARTAPRPNGVASARQCDEEATGPERKNGPVGDVKDWMFATCGACAGQAVGACVQRAGGFVPLVGVELSWPSTLELDSHRAKYATSAVAITLELSSTCRRR